MLCPKWVVEKPKNDSFQQPPRQTSHGTNVGYKFQFKHKKQVYQAVSKKNGASSSGMKTNSEVETSSTNPFDALNTIEKDDELGSNGGSSNSGKKNMSISLING
ncbi:hypothetical protein CTI12_AA175430 [Artemisia annua]|uniref:Uncharacterized protein n=1 Tax=Artemisia annua TaxID=35608 RepID=A0A2U1PAH5_ARTAN|nr:hypothetical protein CTI12_AA175430 [Artemisia annua]